MKRIEILVLSLALLIAGSVQSSFFAQSAIKSQGSAQGAAVATATQELGIKPTADLAAAKALVQQAGAPAETITVWSSAERREANMTANYVADVGRQLGLKMKVKTVPIQEYSTWAYDPAVRAETDLALTLWWTDVAEPLQALWPVAEPGGRSNYNDYRNPAAVQPRPRRGAAPVSGRRRGGVRAADPGPAGDVRRRHDVDPAGERGHPDLDGQAGHRWAGRPARGLLHSVGGLRGRSLSSGVSEMPRLLARRLAGLLLTLVASSFLVFSSLYLAPGDPVATLSGGRTLPPEAVQALTSALTRVVAAARTSIQRWTQPWQMYTPGPAITQ